jgi:hypothetical protein
VYKQYVAAALIVPNEVSIFAFPEYISNNTAVILGQKLGRTISTISAVLDSKNGLPLDNLFKKSLHKLRSEGKKLMEIGLLADLSKDRNSFSQLVELMAAAARFGVVNNCHDVVLGVHPRRVRFFREVFGCKQVSDTTEYDSLNAAPVVLMHTCGQDPETGKLPAWKKINGDELDLNFSQRYLFNPHNSISQVEFDLSVDTIMRKVWNMPLSKTA